MRYLLVIMAAMFTLAGCDRNDGPAEKMGESIDEAVDEAKAEADEMGDEMEEAAEDAKRKVEDATD